MACRVVWCRFPYNEAPNQPAAVTHPVIIKRPFKDQNGQPWATVIYGTSKDPYRSGPSYWTIDQNLAQFGLNKPTRFNLAREATVPWASEFFPAGLGQAPQAWLLSADLIQALQGQAAVYKHSLR